MDYFVWTIQAPGASIAVDCGFTVEVAERRGRRCLVDALELVGIECRFSQHIVITHLHYDHAGNLQRFPNARFHLQTPEMHHTCGPRMAEPFNAHNYECEDIVDMASRACAAGC